MPLAYLAFGANNIFRNQHLMCDVGHVIVATPHFHRNFFSGIKFIIGRLGTKAKLLFLPSHLVFNSHDILW